jgi:hypothetical protein
MSDETIVNREPKITELFRTTEQMTIHLKQLYQEYIGTVNIANCNGEMNALLSQKLIIFGMLSLGIQKRTFQTSACSKKRN